MKLKAGTTFQKSKIENNERGEKQMKRKMFAVKIIALCLICFVLVTPLTINAVEYSVNEDGAVMAGDPVHERIYTIFTQSNKSFDVYSGWVNDNTEVWTYTYGGHACQEWKFIKQGNDYAIQDTNSQKFLTVQDNPSSSGAEFVIQSKSGANYSANQLFKVQQIGTSMRYRILTKSSNYTLAIGYSSSGYLCQLPTSNSTTQVYLKESAPYHGIQEGYVHINEYNEAYARDDMFIGIDNDLSGLCASVYSNSANYQWLVRYRGNGCYSFANNGFFLTSYGDSIGDEVRSASFGEDSLWRVIKSNDYYELVPNSAYAKLDSGEIVINCCFGLNNNAPVLVSNSNPTRKWRIIRSHYYYNYDLSMYVIEDDSHSDTHAYLFNYVCPALYSYGGDNQNLHYEVDDEVDLDANDITEMIDLSEFFIIYAHGSTDASYIVLNARNSSGNNKGERVIYDISNISQLNDNALYSLKCAIFFSCHSAEGVYNYVNNTNFVNEVIDRGARSAIGFDGKLDCEDAEKFADIFFYKYSDTIGSAAARALDAYEEAVFYSNVEYSEDFMPYYTNGILTLKDQPVQ